MDEKKKKLTHSLGDDSGEMEVIKDIFSSPEPTGGSSDIFASDLFTADPFAPAPKPEPAPVPAQPVKEQIKVVTNEDFQALMQDTTSPGIPAPVPAPPERPPASPPLGARVPSPAPSPRPAPPKPAPAAPPAPAPKRAAPPKPAPVAAPAAKTPAVSPSRVEPLEDIVLQAVAEDYHAVGAAKKGAALEQVAHELEGLEPMGDDFMSIEEMKKLFGNVNAIMESIPRVCKRLDRLEEALAKAGLLKPEKK